MNGLVHPVVDLLLAVGVAGAAWRVRALTFSGAIAAVLVGWAHASGGGTVGTAALLTFFSTSTALSRLGKRRKDSLGFEKGGTRDHAQVLANGGAAALAAVWIGVQPESQLALASLLGALATANADTWATELGSLLGGNPRRITNLQPARPGESGAVSVVGTLAALAGAALVAIVGGALSGRWGLLPVVAIAGLAGALLDSLLGATVQAMRHCPNCGARTEAKVHCGVETSPGEGWAWMDNDRVNACATVAGAALAAMLARIV